MTADAFVAPRIDPAAGLVTVTVGGDGTAIMRLNRADARNALSLAMISAIRRALAAVSGNRNVRAVVLTGEGPAFCAGHDLKEMTAHRDDDDGGRAFFHNTMRSCAEMMQDIVACPKPVIAAVHGVATAAGCQLVASCDLAVAAQSARFATPGVNIGLFCSTPMVALARNISRKRAMEMLLLGDAIPANEAAAYGLVNRVVPDGTEIDAALDLARTIAAKSEATIALGKRAFHDQIEQPLGQAYAAMTEVMVCNMMTDDAREGIEAFLNKRPAVWKRL